MCDIATLSKPSFLPASPSRRRFDHHLIKCAPLRAKAASIVGCLSLARFTANPPLMVRPKKYKNSSHFPYHVSPLRMTFASRLRSELLTAPYSGFFRHTLFCRTFSILCSTNCGYLFLFHIFSAYYNRFCDWYIFWKSLINSKSK